MMYAKILRTRYRNGKKHTEQGCKLVSVKWGFCSRAKQEGKGTREMLGVDRDQQLLKL